MLTNKISGQKKRMGKQSESFPIFKSINDKSSLLALKPGYSIFPNPQEIFERQFMVKDLTIRNEYAEVTWRGVVDLRKLKVPLESLIDLGPTHIEVYPDERLKPLAGMELNKICFATFKNLKRMSNRKLLKICDGNGCELLEIDRDNGKFTVQIPHFTIYKFSQEQDDESESEENEDEINLVKILKEKNEQQLLKEQQKERETNFNDHPTLTNRFLPTQPFLERVENHNRNNGHIMSHERIRGSQITSGVNGVVTSASKSNKAHFALFCLPKEVDRSEFNIVEKILKDQNETMSLIISPETPFQIKSALSLNAICFDFTNIKFDFIKTSDGIEFSPINRPPESHYRTKYLGNWLEWVINNSVKPEELPSNDIIQALCLRKGAEKAEKLLSFKRNNDAEFLSKIEDATFRSEQTASSMCQELRNVKNGDMSFFNNLEWIVKLGVYIWYFLVSPANTEEEHREALCNILLENTDTKYRFELERQILLTFLNLCLPLKRTGSISDENLPVWWLISNLNSGKEKKLNKDSSEYREYRCELASQICQKFADSYIALQIISNDHYLEKSDKFKILNIFVKSFPEEARRIPIADWKEYSDIVNENKGISLFGEGRYFEALETFALCQTLSSDTEIVIKEIASFEEILCGFLRKTIEKSKALLEKLQTTVLEDELLFMRLILEEQQIDEKSARKVISFCYKIHQEGLRRRMLECIFKLIVSNPNIIVELRKETSFYGFIDEIYKDPSYRLQLKLVKLET